MAEALDPLFALAAEEQQLSFADMQMTDDFLGGVETPLQSAALFSSDAATAQMEPRNTPAAKPPGMPQRQTPMCAIPKMGAPLPPSLPKLTPLRRGAVDDFEAVVAATAAVSGDCGPFSPGLPDVDDDWAAMDDAVFGAALDLLDAADGSSGIEPPLALSATPLAAQAPPRSSGRSKKRKLSGASTASASSSAASSVTASFCASPRSTQQRVSGRKRIKQEPGAFSFDAASFCGLEREGSEDADADMPHSGSSSSSKRVARRWTPAQDDELRCAVAKFKGQNWKAIARLVTGRDHVQCLQRYRKVLQPGLVKGMWSAEEDALLVDLMTSSRPKNWADIAARVPGRTAKQCRERWSLNLDPGIKRSAWTEREDDLLVQLHARLGNRWAEIKRHLPGRTENGVKTRFKSIERARGKDEEVLWTPQLEGQLHEVAARFEGRIDDVAKHLPRALRGISSRAMREHCPQLCAMEHDAAAASASAAVAAARVDAAAVAAAAHTNPLLQRR